ncbi:hypothetical protein KI387_004518, partial [Taxus chinensis]
MSEQGNLEASEEMHGLENLSGLPHYKCSSLITEENSQMHGGFEKEIPFVTECKQNDLSNMKDYYDIDSVKKVSGNSQMRGGFEKEILFLTECKQNDLSDMKDYYDIDSVNKVSGNSLRVNLIVESEGVGEEAKYSDTEDYPTEDLRDALEVDLHVNNADKCALCIDLPEMGADLSCKDKKKRKKKRKGPSKNPTQIIAFKEEEQKKVEQSKSSLHTKEAVMCRTLSKSATFPGSFLDAASPEDVPNLEVEDLESATENGTKSECGCSNGKNSFYARTVSFPPSLKLIPAIRGGHENNGLGPRPKLCVKWAADVYEPPSSSVSHTVRNYHRHQSKKKDNKHKQKGKSSPRSASIENEKQLVYNLYRNSEGVYSRLHSSMTQNAEKTMLSDVLPSRSSGLMPDKSRLTSLKAPLLNMQIGQNGIPFNTALMHSDDCHGNQNNDFGGKCTDDLVLEGKDNLPNSSEAEFTQSQDSKCASSFLRSIESKQLSFAEATR